MAEVDYLLEEIERKFIPGTVLTLCIRTPGGSEQSVLLTLEKDIEVPIALMRELWNRKPTR